MAKIKNIVLVAAIIIALAYCLGMAYNAGVFDTIIKPRIYKGVFVIQTGGKD